ncbi:MAG: hypothetical protein KF889_09245 [Alphaproteobacteria bacterium]|nr:hypothetical protein [Alphaproteobacteria bacterium]MCW5741008.1 hypothetical protein [Alphaproteobacteria bacterium]
MNRIEYVVEMCVLRGCGFGVLAIATTMAGLAFDLVLSFKVGAALTTFMYLVLEFQHRNALRVPIRRTEAWLLLDRGRDLPPGYPETVIQQIRSDVIRRYAALAGYTALSMCVIAAGLHMVK